VNGREFLTELVERVHALSLNPRNLVANKICQGTNASKNNTAKQRTRAKTCVRLRNFSAASA
jgi:hypothetical protein